MHSPIVPFHFVCAGNGTIGYADELIINTHLSKNGTIYKRVERKRNENGTIPAQKRNGTKNQTK